MIFDYGYSTAGKSHIANGTCCQDNHRILKMDNGWYLAAIADGVGSAKNSHIGSKIAADTVVDFCNSYMPWDYSLIGTKSMMRTAYNHAFRKILERAEQDGEPIESYDTTLSLVIYDGHRVIFGHSGDGAVFGLTVYGDFVEITSPQKGEDGVSVVPLRAGYERWVIDSYEEELAAVMLVTDGMRETLCPYLLRNAGGNYNHVYAPLGLYFTDPNGIYEAEEEQERIRSCFTELIDADDTCNCDAFYARLLDIYKKHIPDKAEDAIVALKSKNYPIVLMKQEQDDKTLVTLINTELEIENKPEDYYSEPDWKSLQEQWNRKAYPHLYRDEQSDDIADGADGSDDWENKIS